MLQQLVPCQAIAQSYLWMQSWRGPGIFMMRATAAWGSACTTC